MVHINTIRNFSKKTCNEIIDIDYSEISRNY